MSEKQSFEATLKKLEDVVKALENKDIALDEAIKQYKAGLELSKACYDMIKDAESLIVEESK